MKPVREVTYARADDHGEHKRQVREAFQELADRMSDQLTQCFATGATLKGRMTLAFPNGRTVVIAATLTVETGESRRG